MEPDQVSIIDTPDVGEAHPAPAKSPCIDDLGYSAATEDDSGKIHPHFIATTRSATTISDVVDTFLSNIKVSCCSYSRHHLWSEKPHYTPSTGTSNIQSCVLASSRLRWPQYSMYWARSEPGRHRRKTLLLQYRLPLEANKT